MALVKKILTKNNKIVKRNNDFISNQIFDNEIIINFSEPPTNLQINKTPLKYNKNFAYSFTMDDGLSSSYNIAFPILQGTLQNGGIFTTGLTYTDSCGNDLNFRFGLSVFSTNTNGSDIHIDTPYYLTWNNMTELLDFDWDIYNHGYRSSITGTSYTEYYNEVKDNFDNILSKTDYKCYHFVIPNGVMDYIEPAWDYGVLSMCAGIIGFTWSGITHNVSSTGLDIHNDMNLYQYVMNKDFIFSLSGSTDIDTTIVNYIDNLANSSTGDTRMWGYQFTHNLDSPSGTSNGNINLATFNYLFYHIFNTYGKNGNDTVWVAPFQEIYDYLYVRDNTNVTYTIDGNSVTVKLNQLTSFDNLRRYQLSLNVTNDSANIQSIILDGYTNYSYNGTGTTNSLINLDWSYGIIILAEKYVRIAEQSQIQTDIDKAQYFVNKIHITDIKNQYQTRINNIVVPSPIILISFGYAPVNTFSITTGITFSGVTSIWNQYAGFASGTTTFSPYTLSNIQGTLTSYSIDILSGFTGGRSSNGATTSDNSGIYPDSRMTHAIYVGTPLSGYIRLSGMDNAKTYNFILFGSRVTNVSTTNYTINSTTVSLNTQNNTQNTVSINNVSPNSGIILIKVSSTTNAYINVLKVVEN